MSLWVRAANRAVALLTVFAGLFVAAPPARGDQVRADQWHLSFLRVAEAHRLSQGESIVVAVVDSGVNASHPDLMGNVLPGTDLIPGGSGGTGQRDTDGHGTGMAAIIAGHGHGVGDGVLGIAPMAKILPIRVTLGGTSWLGRTLAPDQHDPLALAISWAVERGASVVNISLGGVPTREVQDVVVRAGQANVVVVASVGNRPEAVVASPLAELPGVVAVAGVDKSGQHWTGSLTSRATALAAPAVDIVSANWDGRYRLGTGTSDATAIVSGAVALVRARYPKLSAAEVVHRLTATAIDKGPPGRDPEYGYGIVNLVDALTANVPPLSPSQLPTQSVSASPGVRPTSKALDGGGGRTALIVALLLLAVLATGGAVALLARRRRTER